MRFGIRVPGFPLKQWQKVPQRHIFAAENVALAPASAFAGADDSVGDIAHVDEVQHAIEEERRLPGQEQREHRRRWRHVAIANARSARSD